MTTEAKQLAPQKKKEDIALKASIRERYSRDNGELRRRDRKFVDELLTSKGFQFEVSEDRKGYNWLDWETKSQDFTALDVLVDKLLLLNGVDDQEYQRSIVSEIVRPVLLGTVNEKPFAPLFDRLDDPNIPTSPAHAGTTPLTHTKIVSELINTLCLDLNEKFLARFFGWTHDLGKVVTANGDYFQLHGEISYLILTEYFKSRREMLAKVLGLPELTDEKIESILRTVRFHHGMELMQRRILTEEQVIELVTAENIKLWGVLSIADSGSVKKYEEFSVINTAYTIQMIMDNAEATVATSLEDIRSLVFYLCNLAKAIPQLNTEIVQYVTQLFEDLLELFAGDEQVIQTIGRSRFINDKISAQLVGSSQSI